MAVLSTSQTFSTNEQVTSNKLNNIISQATFTSRADTTDNSTLDLVGGKLKVADAGIGETQLASDSVTASKILNSNIVTDKIANDAVTLAKMEDGTRGDIITYDSATEPTRLAVGAAGKYLRVNSAGTDVEWASNELRKFATGWANTHGSVTVANGSTHTITHSLNTKDVTVQVYISSASDGSNPQSILGVSTDSAQDRGSAVTNLADNTATIQLGGVGYLDTDSNGLMSITPFTSKYINIVVIG